MICHVGFQALAVFALAKAMVLMPFGTQALLIMAIGLLTLQATGFTPAVTAAVPLAAIAVAADVKHPTAGSIVTNELVKDAGTGSRHGP